MKRGILVVILIIILSSFVNAGFEWDCKKLIEGTSSRGPLTLGSQAGFSGNIYGENLIVFQSDNEGSFTSVYNLNTNQIKDIPREYYVISGNGEGLLLQNHAKLQKDLMLHFYDFNNPFAIEILPNTNEIISSKSKYEGEKLVLLPDKNILYINTGFRDITIPSRSFQVESELGSKNIETGETIEKRPDSKILIKYNPYTKEEELVGSFESNTEMEPRVYTSGPYEGKIYFTEINPNNYYIYNINEDNFKEIDLPRKGELIGVYDNKAIFRSHMETGTYLETESSSENIRTEKVEIIKITIIDINTNEIIKELEVLGEQYIGNGMIAFTDSIIIRWASKLPIPLGLVKSIFSFKPYVYDLSKDMIINLPLIDARLGIPQIAYHNHALIFTKVTKDIFVNLDLPKEEGMLMTTGRDDNKIKVSDLYKCEIKK